MINALKKEISKIINDPIECEPGTTECSLKGCRDHDTDKEAYYKANKIIKLIAGEIHEDIIQIAAVNHNDKDDTITRVPFIATVDQIFWTFYGSEYDKSKIIRVVEETEDV